MAIPPAPNTKGPDGDDILIDPPNEPGVYSRVIIRLLDNNELPETKYREIQQEFLTANPAFATRQIRVTWLRTIQEDPPSGQRKGVYRITALEEPQEVEIGFLFDAAAYDEDAVFVPVQVQITTGDGQPLKQTAAVKIRDTLTGTATPGTDYEDFPSVEVVFPAGTPSGTVLVVNCLLIDDPDPEPDETIIFDMFDFVNAVQGSFSTFTATINDNDAVQEITITFLGGPTNIFDFDPDPYTIANVQVNTSDLAPTAVLCSVDVVDLLTGTAVPGVNYDNNSPYSISFAPGTVNGSLGSWLLDRIPPCPDPPRTVNVDLQNAVNATAAGAHTVNLIGFSA